MIEIVDYSPLWPAQFLRAKQELLLTCPGVFVEIEHVGSTAVLGLAAKPTIDVMAAVAVLQDVEPARQSLLGLGYHHAEIGMPRRLFFRRGCDGAWTHHLHVVEMVGWDEQKERMFRDGLRGDAALRQEYADLKRRLAGETADLLTYTRAKTSFVQRVLDAARAARGLPLVSAWEEDSAQPEGR